MHGLIQSQPVGPGPSSRHRIPNQSANGGSLTYKQWYAPTVTLSYFYPLHQSKPPVFTKNCLPKSSIFSILSKILENFHSKAPNRLEFEKKSYAPYFYGFCHWKTLRPISCLACTCLRGMLLPQTRSAEAGKFCILETELCNLVNTFRCKLNQGDENKISVLQTQPTHLYIMDELHWRAGLIHRPSSLRSNMEGDISYNHPLYDCAQRGSLNKCQVFLRLCKRRHVKCKVQCRARWRARENLKYRSNLRLYPVNFSNKLCILMFIILSIWPNFFDPPFTTENFLVPPPLLATQNFSGPPLHFAQPPHQSIYEHSLRKWTEYRWKKKKKRASA